MCDDEHNKCPLSISDWITIIENEISINNVVKSASLIVSVISLIFFGFISLMSIKMFQANVKLIQKINELSLFNESININDTCPVYENMYIFYGPIEMGNSFISVINMIIFMCILVMVFLFILETKYTNPYRKDLEKLRNGIISGEFNTLNKIHTEYLRIQTQNNEKK